ncbi:MAG TPA: hypothetical protein VMN60_04655 [Longimicrobiales bacterium]|nr:hypothetical protein [Longimicrobiales bacterium]
MTLRLILALILIAPNAAAAQGPPAQTAPERLAPGHIRDHVAQITDTLRLRVLEREFARSRDDDSVVAAGLAALRLWEVTGERAHARRSRGHFDRAARHDSGNAWAHYGHALSLAAEMDRDAGRLVTHINAARDLGLDPVSRARRALERAVALDPSLPGAVDLLARYSVTTRDEDGLILARTSFETSASGPAGGETELLGVALTARELGDHAGAAAAARRAIAAGNASASSYLSLAVSLAGMPDSLAPAGVAYGNALRLADAAMLERLWDDAGMLRSAKDSAEWVGTDPVHRRSMLRSFWDVRGALAGLTGDERAAEHYRRVAVARRRFHRRGMFGAAPGNALLLEKVSAAYDDRGVIYVRHGEPEHTIGVPPLQEHIAWFYESVDGQPRSYHFEKRAEGPSRDYLLMYNLPCLMDPMAATFDPRLTPLVKPSCDWYTVRSISAEIGRDSHLALRSDSHSPAFDADVPFHYDFYSFRAAAGTELLMAVGVPLDRLPPGQRSLRMRLSVVDTARAATAHTSRITELLERRTDPGIILRTHLSLLSPAAAVVYRIDVRDASNPRIGTIYGGDIELPDYTGDTLMISDVVLAEQRDSGNVQRGGTRLALSPTQVFRNGEFRVYYEIYNLPPGTAYSTELVLEPFRDGIGDRIRSLFSGADDVELRFDDTVPPDAGSTLPQIRDVTAPYRPGAWLLRVTITTAAGRVTRERRFAIEER